MNLICYKTGLDIQHCHCPDCQIRRTLAMITQVPSGSIAPLPVPPPKEAPKDELLPDIEVGRYALRTFRVDKQRLKSLFQEHYWDGGTAVAECLNKSKTCESSPSLNCMCGIYGTLTIEHLFKEYGQYARDCVAVFAAEGTTILGTKGLRTAAARIVAYWCTTHVEPLYDPRTEAWGGDVVRGEVPFWRDDGKYIGTFAKQCPDARRFESIEEMLEAYHFPKADKRVLDVASGWAPHHPSPMAYTPPPVAPPASYVRLTDDQVKKVKEQLGVDSQRTGFTTKGREAISHILKFLT